MNHLSKKAVKNYLSRFDRAFKSSKTSYPHTFFNDSYEVYQADWTDDFLEQFNTFSIYEILPQLIELRGLKTATQVESKKNIARMTAR